MTHIKRAIDVRHANSACYVYFDISCHNTSFTLRNAILLTAFPISHLYLSYLSYIMTRDVAVSVARWYYRLSGHFDI
jgi:hypothetical protein